MKILVVCLGNICRSPMAEGILRKIISERNLKFVVDSAGTANYHVGESPDDRAIKISENFGVDISKLKGRQFSVADFDSFDRIYAMDSSNYKNITSLARNETDREKVYYFLREGKKSMNVPDPWYGGLQDFISVYHLLEDGSKKIIDEIITEIKTA